MKTLTKDGVSVYLLADSDTVNILDNIIEVRGERDFNIGDMNSSNAALYENVTAPADWKGTRYTFDGTTWARNLGEAVPQEVSMRQARLALLEAGLLDQVNTAMQTADPAAQIEWEYSTTVERTSVLVDSIGSSLGLTSAQIDDLFRDAATR